ncbi:2-oxo acid dehydrogenase subunit E2 [Glaciihabitans sp. INWT7]|uniref:dihydrolipoamide acetyltransferase family protein n=1 Tax=Glaciihabitans sp. INWT7 TaxID=2596912 RepID=UPI001625D3B6|nr:dihydrolipoamide acetyltransferase family protein [Glaciihabitans sp. INWT7]QNE47729.1 2-oxo acid dehydrogenase subunit E2 [Glaciihabitans sp. INWT7]
MATDFLLPDLGEGLTDAEIVRWLVKAGDEVALNQIICEVETAKALVELPSPIVGVVSSLRVSEGETVMVGAPIISFGADDLAREEPDEDGRSNMLVGYGPSETDQRSGHRRRRGAPAVAADSAAAPATLAPPAPAAPSRVLAKPPVRDLARRLGLDLTTVIGTGSNGAVIRSDVEAASGAPATGGTGSVGTASAAGDRPEEIRVPISGVRKRTAAAMVSSAFTAPHVTEFLTVDVTPTVELVEHLRAHPAFEGARVTPLLLVAKALATVTLRHPELNSRWDEASQEIVTPRAVNLGIAVATPRGLMVPNVPDVNSLTLRELADALSGLATRARGGKTGVSELSGGTISITNIGSFGIDSGTPIINPGEAAILCTGAIRRQPWEFRGEIALRSVMTLSVSFDHRLVDGAEGSAFLADIGRILADPLELIALG